MEDDLRLNELTRYELSFRDMLMALYTLGLAGKTDDLAHRSVCLDMAVVAYARPFVKNFGTPGWPLLKIEALFDQPLCQKDASLHYLVCKLRASVVAHSDAEMARTYSTAMRGVVVFGTAISTLVDLQPELPRFEALATPVRDALLDKVNALSEELGRPPYRPQPWPGHNDRAQRP